MAPSQIKIADTKQEFEQGKMLFREYARTLPFDLGYQDFEQELNSVEQQYKPPEGALLLCFSADAEVIGCVADRKFSPGTAELKRLYVKPGYRSLKIGLQLLEAAISTARQLNYQLMRLDTVPGQSKAQELYRSFGFYEIGAYRYSPIEGTIYFEKKLGDG